MIVYDGRPIPAQDDYETALAELDRLDLERRRLEKAAALANSRYEAAWYKVLHLEEQLSGRVN